jgi:4-hydroxy-3-methylbut-2-enyl diphosphate reductase
VDLGTKHAGYIPLNEISDDPSVKPEDLFKIGDEVECFTVRVNDVEGTAMLSKKTPDAVKTWENIENAVESREILEGVVTEENKAAS